MTTQPWEYVVGAVFLLLLALVIFGPRLPRDPNDPRNFD